jgi:signal transduction histidine kinase
MEPTTVRTSVATAGVALALASALWIDPAQWATYAVFLAFAFAFSFVWLDSDAPTSVAHMATATAFVYIAGFPILFFELAARALAYPLIFAAARRGLIALPRPLRPLASHDPAVARAARLDLAAMLGLATIGMASRVAVVQIARATGFHSLIAMIWMGEPVAYGVMGALSAWLPLPTGQYLVAAPHRLPAEDERVDVIFAAVLIVPFLVLLIVYGWLEHGLIGAAAWSLTSLAPHGLVQLLVQRRHLLDERRAALERKRREMEHFTYTVAHDLKVPLSGIVVAADRMLDAELADPVRADLKRIVRLAGTTQQMTVDLLGMVRIVSEPEPVETVDLGAVTEQALEALQPHIAARAIVVDVAAPLPVVPGQANKLRHVVGNLVGNAIRFVPPETGRVGVSATRDGAWVVLTVRDNGVGIPAQYHQAIFEMFQRVPNGDGGHAGSGMGLAIVKRIVETHGGEVWVESTPGVGSVFQVRLPAG